MVIALASLRKFPVEASKTSIMVLGLRSKNRRSTALQVDYLIHVQEIKPWPPSLLLKSAQSVLLQWENGDQSYGSFTSNFEDGKVKFSESFRLPVTLCKEASKKGTGHDSFQKNCLEFNLYEPRKDKAMKGQLLGSAVINLADYGIIKDTVSINTPINFKKSSKSTVQPVLYVNIQPFDRDGASLSKEASLDNDGSESVSEVTNGENDVECEIASFTDDDDDGGVSLHSSRTVSSFPLESSRVSPGQHDKHGSESANSGTGRVNREPTLPPSAVSSNPEVNSVDEGFKHRNEASSPPSSSDLSSNMQNPVSGLVLSDDYVHVSKSSNQMGVDETRTNHGAGRKAWGHDTSGLDRAGSSKNGSLDQDGEFLEANRYTLERKLVSKLPQDARRQVQLRSNTLASDWTAAGMQGNMRRDRLKHLKSVQLQFDSADGDGSFSNSQLMEKTKKISIPEKVHKGGMGCAPTERPGTTSVFSDNEIKLKSKVEMHEEQLSKADGGLVEHGNYKNEVKLMENSQGIDLPENVNNERMNCRLSEREETKCNSPVNRIKLETKVEMLEEELIEAAAIEVGLYSVIAEHGASINKVHAPARRLSRFYLQACKARSPATRASAARAIISGLVLVSKACGNDVPRLSFWLSNSILLRAIISQVTEKLQLASVPHINNNGGQKGWIECSPCEKQTDKTESCDYWEEPQTYVVALENVEAWIFSRIVESVWWQTLTPHMQSAAVKGSSSKKSHARRYGLGDQEQGNFATSLWKKAFKDACERLCPIRAGGHECGCLPVLPRLVMEQLVGRLDVAMFNAILRESVEEIPTDPVSDPISDPKVLPIPAGKSSFGAGVQLKNAVGSWSRWLSDLFGIDDTDSPEDKDELDGNRQESETSFKAFHILNALSDLMMLPFEMLADRSTRKEVCPIFDAPLIKRVLNNFVPDEFSPDPIPDAILEALDSEDLSEAGKESATSFPWIATPAVYSPPSAASLMTIVGEVGNQMFQRSGSALLRKSYTSDDELDELDSPMASIIVDNSKASLASPVASTWTQMGGRKVVRYKLLQEVWKNSE